MTPHSANQTLVCVLSSHSGRPHYRRRHRQQKSLPRLSALPWPWHYLPWCVFCFLSISPQRTSRIMQRFDAPAAPTPMITRMPLFCFLCLKPPRVTLRALPWDAYAIGFHASSVPATHRHPQIPLPASTSRKRSGAREDSVMVQGGEKCRVHSNTLFFFGVYAPCFCFCMHSVIMVIMLL